MTLPLRSSPLAPLLLALACGGGDGKTTGATDDATGTTDPGTTSTTTTGPDPSTSTTAVDPTTSTAGETTGASTTTSTTGSTTDTTTGSTGTTGGTTGGDAPIVVEGLSHPESILHDTTDDVYLISNINGAPDAADDNGFLARVLPDGTIDALEWISGATDAVELHAPKGMALVGDTLYVTDITVVRKFDRVTGAPLGTITVDGAAFLNDLSADPLGNVYLSDSGTDSVHVIDTQDK